MTAGRDAESPRWALLGKLPGDKADHRILRGGPGEPGDIATLIRAAIPGTPQLGSLPGPGALPWVTFVPSVDESGHDRIGVAVIEATADRDLAGRPNFATRYVSVPYALVASRRVSYQALHAAAVAADLPGQGEQIDLDFPPGPESDPVAALADPALFAEAAAIAGLVLCGDVVITPPGRRDVTLRGRLAEFDRVATLLPFGMRASMSVATWDDGTTNGTFRLAYGPFAAHGQTVVTPGQGVAWPAAGAGGDYREALERLRGRMEPGRLAGYLAAHREPLGPDDGERAVDILRSLAEPRAVVDAVRTGRAPLQLVVAIRRYVSKELDQDSLDALETYMLAHGRGDRMAREVRGLWSDRSAALAARVALRIAAGEKGDRAGVRLLLAVAAEHDEAGAFLAEMVRSGLPAAGAPVSAQELARVLLDLVTPVPGKLASFRGELLRRRALSRWVLRESLAAAPDGHAWRDWLTWLDPADGAAPAWISVYADLVSGAASAPSWAADGGPAGRADPEDLALAARIACRIYPGLSPDQWSTPLRLARQGASLSAQARADLAALSDEALSDKALSDKAGDPPVGLPLASRLDTLRLYLGMPPRCYPTAGGIETCLPYLDALWTLWSAPPLAADAASLTVRLLRAVLPVRAGRGMAAPRDPFGEPVIAVLVTVVRDGRIPLTRTAADVIADACAVAPELLDDPGLPPDWWARVESFRPGLRGPLSRLRGAVRQPEPDPVEIAVLLGRAAAAGVAAAELVDPVAPWLATRDAGEISAMFRVVGGVVSLCGGGPALASEAVRSLARELASGLPSAARAAALAMAEFAGSGDG